jgi:hypothetical protein
MLEISLSISDIKEAKHIVFAGNAFQPIFYAPAIRRNKGELFIIKAPELVLDVIVNTSIFYSAFRE